MMIGEIGGSPRRRRAAEFIAEQMTKPVVAYIAGVDRPGGAEDGPRRGDRLGLAGHRAGEDRGALAAAGATVAENPTDAGELMVEVVRALP